MRIYSSREDWADLYFEAHVTVAFTDNPVTIAAIDEICRRNGFRRADLVMIRNGDQTVSTKDIFMSARSDTLTPLKVNTIKLVDAMILADIKVLRYKIEDTVLDSKIDDIYSLLEKTKCSSDTGASASSES